MTTDPLARVAELTTALRWALDKLVDARNVCYGGVDVEEIEERQALLTGTGDDVLADRWQPIAKAPRDVLIDVWVVSGDHHYRLADCAFDTICGQWRTSRPAGQLICIPERMVTHWMHPPAGPAAPTEGWIEWKGGDKAPVDVPLWIRCRDGREFMIHDPVRFKWDVWGQDGDIVAYKVVRLATAGEGGR